MKSKYANKCKVCSEAINIGDDIDKNSDGNWVHSKHIHENPNNERSFSSPPPMMETTNREVTQIPKTDEVTKKWIIDQFIILSQIDRTVRDMLPNGVNDGKVGMYVKLIFEAMLNK